jgi:hypothetical protein
MSTRFLLALAGALLIVRLPSLVQPMGPDQGLYAYVGERILHGELAYRDAWDQKPPGIHYVYAGLRAAYPHDAAVPAADLLAAIGAAAAVWAVGARLAGGAAGGLSAILFLLLSDPSFARYGGVRVRAQCETFIALSASVAVLLALTRARGIRRRIVLFASGLFVGVAFALKYNAGIYGLVTLAAVALTTGLTLGDVVVVALGAAVVPLTLLAVFLNGGAMRDLYQATIAYNLQYSGETYASRLDTLRYLISFPVQHARVDALWTVGGAGCLVLLLAGIKRRPVWLPVAWVVAACLAIAINGSRGLPQYFVQAAPALALAAGVGAAVLFPPLPRVARWILVILVGVAVWRVDEFPKLASNVWHDTKYITGRIDRREYLARYGGLRESDKYSALNNIDLGATLDTHSRPGDTVYVFGFSPGAYVYAGRRSASRFFWSRPVIVGFNAADPRYGVAGLLTELRTRQPAVIALQHHDWYPDVQDSAAFFMSQPALAAWLRSNYHEVRSLDAFSTWERNTR